MAILSFIEDCWSNVVNKYYSITHWWRICGSRKFYWKLIGRAFCSYPYDGCYMYILELAKLKQMKDYFSTAGLLPKNSYANIVKWINVAISLLEIINDESSLFEYPVEDKTLPQDLPYYERIKHVSLVKVNFRNMDRFLIGNDNKKREVFERFPEELYLLKAKYLYNKIKFLYLDYWWD